jgi:hypothetical protein
VKNTSRLHGFRFVIVTTRDLLRARAARRALGHRTINGAVVFWYDPDCVWKSLCSKQLLTLRSSRAASFSRPCPRGSFSSHSLCNTNCVCVCGWFRRSCADTQTGVHDGSTRWNSEGPHPSNRRVLQARREPRGGNAHGARPRTRGRTYRRTLVRARSIDRSTYQGECGARRNTVTALELNASAGEPGKRMAA